MDNIFSAAKRIVVKVGSNLITKGGQGLDHTALAHWAEQIVDLRKRGYEVALVSSGAIAEGMKRLGWKKRPRAVYELQAAAAVGQMGLVEAYESCFRKYGIHTAQILLTHEDLSDRTRYLNARSTVNSLIHLGTIPIINENDTVATDEIRFGDNDTLAALVTNLMEAHALIILTDQPGLYSKDPRQHGDAEFITTAIASDPALLSMAGGVGTHLGRGGMITKVHAARRAARSGAHTIIVSGDEPNVLRRLVGGEAIGTRLLANTMPLTARKQWLADHLQVRGKVRLDDGAIRALTSSNKSLLPVGVVEVFGTFERGEVVSCIDQAGTEVARGLANYSASETAKILRQPSAQIEAILGYVDEPELIHRDNLVLL